MVYSTTVRIKCNITTNTRTNTYGFFCNHTMQSTMHDYQAYCDSDILRLAGWEILNNGAAMVEEARPTTLMKVAGGEGGDEDAKELRESPLLYISSQYAIYPPTNDQMHIICIHLTWLTKRSLIVCGMGIVVYLISRTWHPGHRWTRGRRLTSWRKLPLSSCDTRGRAQQQRSRRPT